MNNQKTYEKFSCKICLEIANDPIITPCGHMYCWICIYQWSEQKKSNLIDCPTCKSSVDIKKLTPVYTSEENKTSHPYSEIPQRPQPERNYQNHNENNNNNNENRGNNINFGFFGLPMMGGFGFSYNIGNFNMNGGNAGNNNMIFFGIVIFFMFIANFFFSAENQYAYTNQQPRQTIHDNANQFRMNDNIGRRGRSQGENPYGLNAEKSRVQTEFDSDWLWNLGIVILFFVIIYLSKYLKSSNN